MPLPRLVVLGCGFGGYSLLRALRRGAIETTLVSPRNHFLFTPLLPSATVGTVELRSILEPVRPRLSHVHFLEAAAERVDWELRQVLCRSAVTGEEFPLAYDLLVVAVGAQVADYGVPGVGEHALVLKEIGDARAIRRRVLEQMAAAEVPGLDPDELRRRLTFLVCGGGPTGVEIAGELADLIDDELRRAYPELVGQVRVVLVEALERLLSGFDEALARYTREHFLREGIEVRLGAKVEAIEARRVLLAGGEAVPCGLIVWAGGNAPMPLVRSLGIELVAGRIPVDETLRVSGREGVWALGDCAAVGDPPLPATAQMAQQQGKYLGRALARLLRGRPVAPFTAHSFGMLAYIGGGRALADLPHVKWSGRTAWLFWRSVYLTRLVSFPNKVKVLFDWAKAAVFGRDLSRF
ncbi:MAG TPA: FAD-dependent oxidoreductase [Thermoanaerobaculia bacterium]|nr:FAD-dependent oxidoreductase [Thermoanaerobaculia bacterium]